MNFNGLKKGLAFALLIASIALVIFYVSNTKTSITNSDTIDDPEIAYRETQKALRLIAKPLNIGMKSVLYVKEHDSDKTKIFIKQE
ncbi:hypothetical protein [Flavobacterium algicola]|uniref:hypothetical protein n=1 Tax=Flavobacterium algicola TaxID=556529 RepID=UPI001EFE65B3|nr:hypothetical protein [Flavobacterium algicola]MCG9792554.1 hypothetical protein [Flavobacterium algicola]